MKKRDWVIVVVICLFISIGVKTFSLEAVVSTLKTIVANDIFKIVIAAIIGSLITVSLGKITRR